MASERYILLAGLWIAWCAVHSAMISPTVSAYLKRKLGDRSRFYRLLYNLTAIATLIPVMVFTSKCRSPLSVMWEGDLRFLRWPLIAMAFGLFAAGARSYDLASMAGLRQLKTPPDQPSACPNDTIKADGILGVVRHPWYLAGIVLIWSYPRKWFVGTLIVNTVLTTYFLVGAKIEERKLVTRWGEAYRRHQRRVSMFLPLKWIYAKFSD